MSALDFALRYAALGWACFPCEPRGKRPATTHGVLDASRDPDVLRRMFRVPTMNIGIAAGASGLVIVDIDPRNGGNDSMRDLVAQHGRLPLSPRARTGSDGVHVYYSAPVGVKLRAKPWKGIDLLRENAYALASPSVHPNGNMYRWDLAALPSTTPVAPLPTWIVDAARVVEMPAPVPRIPRPDAGNVVERARKWLACCEPSIMGSNGSAALMHATSGLLVGFELDEADVLTLIFCDFNARCKPRWRDREILHAIASAKRSPKPRGYLLDAPRRVA